MWKVVLHSSSGEECGDVQSEKHTAILLKKLLGKRWVATRLRPVLRLYHKSSPLALSRSAQLPFSQVPLTLWGHPGLS